MDCYSVLLVVAVFALAVRQMTHTWLVQI